MHSLTSPVIRANVFANGPDGGNPCPIVFEADQLSDTQMQRLAARFGVETAFVLPPHASGCDLRLRYFVPQHEMEMCGHATVGTVSVLVSLGRLSSSPVGVETPLGPIPVHWRRDTQGVLVTVEQFAPRFAEQGPACAEVAAALRIPEEALDLDLGPVQSVSTARAKLMVPLRTRAILDGLRPDFERLWSLCAQHQITGFYPFTTDTANARTHAEARQFPRQAGYDEDPATGVAACALAAYLTEHRVFGEKTPGWHGFRIEQGRAMGRPSVIQAEACVEAQKITKTRMSGRATIVSEEAVDVMAA